MSTVDRYLPLSCSSRRSSPPRHSSRHAFDERGLALIATLLVVVLIAGIIAAGLRTAMSVTRSSNADYRGARAFYAAEAGAEAALAQIEAALLDGRLSDEELAAIQPPELAGFDFAEFAVERDGPVVSETLTDGPFAGLYSLTQNIKITSTASDASDAHSVVVLGAKAQAIPMFQFAVFFEGGAVDAAGSRKDMVGRIHSNRGFFLTGCDLHFHEMLTTPSGMYRDGMITHQGISASAGNPCGINVFIEDASGTESQLTFDSADTPGDEAFKLQSELYFDSRLQTGAFGVDSLKLPLPDGVTPREIIRPKEDSDTDTEKGTKFAWKADMYVKVDLGNVRPRSQTCSPGPPTGLASQLPTITVERTDGGPVPNGGETCHIFQMRWEAFFDNHEEGWVDVLDVDIVELRSWLVANGDEVGLIYVEFLNVDAATSNAQVTDKHTNGNFTGVYFPILRIINGAQLPGPLTLGSPRPLYVQGDYNTIDWKPSALFGDRLTALSNSWSDDDPCNQIDHEDRGCGGSSNTAMYFAVVTGTGEGNIGCFHEDPACLTTPPYGPGGWVKLLEDWQSCPGQPEGGRCKHTFIGSFISLWAPQIASPWGSYPGSDYYVRPIRDWSFDSRFTNPDNLPPGTPVVGQVFRAAFRESY